MVVCIVREYNSLFQVCVCVCVRVCVCLCVYACVSVESLSDVQSWPVARKLKGGHKGAIIFEGWQHGTTKVFGGISFHFLSFGAFRRISLFMAHFIEFFSLNAGTQNGFWGRGGFGENLYIKHQLPNLKAV